MSGIKWLAADDRPDAFPDPSTALTYPNGLLAAGGDLAPDRLLAAYARGIFPWYEEDQPILWWSPDPRAVLFPDELRVSRSLRRTIRKARFRLTSDLAFHLVVKACSTPRPGSGGTWITTAMINAYTRLHKMGFAHSVESWLGNQLVGGLYGIAIGNIFFGESMFSKESDASKVALVHLVEMLKRKGYRLVDCQIPSDHLFSLGSREIPRDEFLDLLAQFCFNNGMPGKWR